jgi:Asp-tRNA(Asn)/Glu-tRNA(Gln) amidotransferase A subunit family amidase
MSLLAREGSRVEVNWTAPRDDVVTRTAIELVALMRLGELSPVEVTDAFLARAEHTQPAVNAFSYVFPDQARRAARAAERRLREEPERCGPLTGLPTAIKELTPVAGQPHTLGSLAFKDVVATATDPAVERLLEAGAIPYARTNSPEFGCASFTDSLLFGETLNPWDVTRSPAGSSGGAAVALATHAAPLAQGSDSAGSLRLPAAACGIVGMKPTWGAVPLRSPQHLETCSHNGPMARDVPDLRLMFDVMAGADRAQLVGFDPVDDGPVDLSRVRVGLIDAMDGIDVHPDVAAHLAHAGRLLEGAGATVEAARFPWSYERLIEATRMVFSQYYGPNVRRAGTLGAELTDYARAFADSMVHLTDDYTIKLRAAEEVAELQRAFGELLGRYDYLLLPSLAAPAHEAGRHFIDEGPVVDGREQPDRWIVAFTVAFNLVSTCPVVSLPTGLSETGLPTAAQVVGRPHRDYSVISVAEQLERLLDQAATTRP